MGHLCCDQNRRTGSFSPAVSRSVDDSWTALLTRIWTENVKTGPQCYWKFAPYCTSQYDITRTSCDSSVWDGDHGQNSIPCIRCWSWSTHLSGLCMTCRQVPRRCHLLSNRSYVTMSREA